jgi:hypothetical protein
MENAPTHGSNLEQTFTPNAIDRTAPAETD